MAFNKTIKEYMFWDHSTTTQINMPIGAKILTAQMQNGQLYLWALVDDIPDEFEQRVFTLYGTGALILEDPGTYITTIQDNEYAWHIFEITL